MQTRFELFDGVQLEVPDHPDFFWPCAGFADFPTCCGAGSGIGDRIVPDAVFKIILSPACWVHDFMWANEVARNNATFCYSNSVFYRNLLAILAVKGKELDRARLKSLVLVVNRFEEAVSTVGRVYYFKSLLFGVVQPPDRA